ncbi:MAG: ATP-dependent deoxyribonuclease subunit A, partial [Armatimonadetes bacterium]|nr:ATP-dependent deoxyribonuclease subunit A [Armatimonadota bacterium]
PIDRAAAIDALYDRLQALASHARQAAADDSLGKSLNDIARVAGEMERREKSRGNRDYDGLEAQFIELSRERHWTWRGAKWARHGFRREEVLDERDAFHADLKSFLQQAGADLACDLQQDLMEVLERYEKAKEKGGWLDFLDLLIRARDLVRDKAAVRAALQKQFSHIYVDEFQDTDPLQAELIMLLAADDPAQKDWRRVRPIPGKLFVVGDPKQSIYRFRRADVQLYARIKRQLLDAGARLVHLQVSFRSLPDIQHAVNAAFADWSGQQAEYVPLRPHRPASTQPAVVALPVPRPYGKRGVTAFALGESFPAAAAAFVDWLVRESGWTVGEGRQVQARDVCLLMKRFKSYGTDLTRAYVRALEARGLPHVLLGGSSFHDREEVEALRNALTAIEWPDGELMVYATLRGPLFALSDAQLLTWKHEVGPLHPYRKSPAECSPALQEVADALAVLKTLSRGRNHHPVATTIARLLEATRAHAGFAVWPTGEQALANITRLMDMARRAEASGLTSFRAFVMRLEDDAARGETGEAPIVEEGTDGVRIMTVHKSKGLEFPVVVLCDPGASGAFSEPSRWIDTDSGTCAVRLAGCAPWELHEHADEEHQRDREEAERLLYVAATRAKDLLVVAAVGDGPADNWLKPLAVSLHPESDSADHPLERAPAGCPRFFGDTVLERPDDSQQGVVPGLHVPQKGEHRVVWWAPGVLRLDVEDRLGQKQHELLRVDESGVQSQAGIDAHEAWATNRKSVREDGAYPSLRVRTPSDAGMFEGASLPEVGLEHVDIPADLAASRPRGARFGTLVHAVLAAVPLDADAEAVGARAALVGRMLGAAEDEVAAATSTALEALKHPLLRAAAASLECRREVPLAVTLENGELVEGIADFAYREAAGWTVIDFKTDHEMDSAPARYRRQVGCYTLAVRDATGQPTRGIILRV